MANSSNSSSRSPALADPSSLAAFNSDNVLQVVIETPKNSRNKYAYDHDRGALVLKKVLPPGMLFPYDFGFVPSTLAEDGDPIDVLVLMDEPAVPGCVLDARAIGVIEGVDELEGGETQRNDRLLAVASVSHTFADIDDVAQLPTRLVENMQEFFSNYPRLLGGKVYKVIGREGPAEAKRLIEEARANAAASHS